MTEYKKPIPVPDADTRPYWEAARRHELQIQRCTSCGSYYFYPRRNCPVCGSDAVEWTKVSGRGTVYSFTVNHRGPGAAFAAEVPYVVALIELAEGPRLMSNVVGCEPSAVTIGMPVEVVFENINDQIALPKFRPA